MQEHIEPSAISKRLAQLEQALGVQLLHRSRLGHLPTPAGEAILQHARNMLFTVRRIQSDAEAFAGGVQGKVRLVASASALAESLLDDTASFMRQPEHRAIKLDIEERPSSEVVRQVRDGDAALGVCWHQGDAGSLSWHPYRHDELVLSVPNDHPLASRKSIAYEEALAYEQVGMPAWSAVTRMLEHAAARCGKRVEWRVVVSNFDAALRVTASGLAIAVFPRQVAAPYAMRRRVKLVSLQDAWAQRQFGVYTREPSGLSSAAGLLLRHLLERAAADEAAGTLRRRRNRADRSR